MNGRLHPGQNWGDALESDGAQQNRPPSFAVLSLGNTHGCPLPSTSLSFPCLSHPPNRALPSLNP